MSDFDNPEYNDSRSPVELERLPAVVYEKTSAFERELVDLINKHSEENDSGTPDFILARHLIRCLDAFNGTVKERAAWRGEYTEIPALQKLKDGKRTVPMVVYSGNLKMRNDIGEAEIQVRPGEQFNVHKIDRVIAVLEEKPNEAEELLKEVDKIDASFQESEKPIAESSFDRYQKKGLSE